MLSSLKRLFSARWGLAIVLLDWPPKLYLSEGLPVHIYDPADRDRYMSGTPIATYDMLQRAKPRVTTRAQPSDGPR